jgi:hypothetical protein
MYLYGRVSNEQLKYIKIISLFKFKRETFYDIMKKRLNILPNYLEFVNNTYI